MRLTYTVILPIVAAWICIALVVPSYAQALQCRASYADSTKGLAALTSPPNKSVTESNSDYLPTWYDMITRIPGDWLEWGEGTSQGNYVPMIVGIAAMTAGLMTIDHQAYSLEKRLYDNSPAFHTMTDGLVLVGDGRFQFGVVGAFAAYGFAFGDIRSLRTASEITESILACGSVVQLLKHLTGRERPEVATERTGDWRFFPNPISYEKHVPHYDSFPSGHIATATTTLIVIAENYPELAWLKPAGYVVLAGISAGLVAYGIHWWSDIPLGVALG